MLHFFFLAHGALGWSDEILLGVVLAAILSYVVGVWYGGRHLAQQNQNEQLLPNEQPDEIILD
jgi:hypothetical protein